MTSREKVLRAATVLFAKRGFQGTSTRDVARRARVNETTIFRLFKHKQELYLQVLEQNMGIKDAERLLAILQSSEDLEKVFLSLAERLGKLFHPIFLRLLFYAALEKPDLLRKHYRASLVSFYQVLAAHIRDRIESEVLRDIDPVLMGRALVGMVAYHQIVCGLWGGDDFPGCNATAATTVYTDIWLRGALAWGAPARQARTEEPLVPTKISSPGAQQFET